jgi:hypothetical protein
MYKIARFAFGLVIFIASYAILTFYVAPFLEPTPGRARLDEAAIARFPVAVVLRRGTDATTQNFAVAQMRSLGTVTTDATSYSFLLPVGSNKIVDQHGEPASYTATEISPGRQRILLRATVGDYTHDVEYEAEEKKVFPLRATYTDLKQRVLLTIPFSALLTWMVLRLTRRRSRTEPHPEAGRS